MSKGQTLAILCVVVALGGRLEVAGDASEKIVARGARMVGGSETIIEKVPWQVSLVYESKGRSMCFCGGSIISSNWVITAAHCVDMKELERSEQSTYVSAGSADCRKGSRHTIVDRIPHPKYELQMQSSEVSINDIALLQVIEAFVFDKTRQPIPLYVRAHATLSQSVATASGWGDTKVDGGGAGFDLKAATLIITSVPVCNDFLSEAYQSSVVPTGQICTQPLSGTPCSGDSGGPLVVNGTLVGITSWKNGLSCSDDDFTVFTEVARYRYWISEMTLL